MLRSNRRIAVGDIKANTGQVALTGVLCRHRLIFPGRFQPSIVSTDELNCRVRDGNGWTLIAIDTDYFLFLWLPKVVTRTRFELVLPA